jgi:membrane-associated protein
MNLRWYVASSLVGAFAWISTWALLGYYLGNVPFVRNNLNTIVMLIVVTVGTVAIIKSIQYRRSIRPQTLD